MKTLLASSRAIDALNTFCGKAVSWLLLLAIIISAVRRALAHRLDQRDVNMTYVDVPCRVWRLASATRTRTETPPDAERF